MTLSEESLVILSHRLGLVKNYFQILLNFTRAIFKICCSLERRCYYISFSPKVNTKITVFFHKCRTVPFVGFDVCPHLVYTKTGTPNRASLQYSVQLLCIFDEAVTAVLSFIDNCERAVVVFITEGKERMLQQIHL